MLARLAIHNVVLIDRLELDLTQGLTAMTGETGAGKSILLDALGLTLGGRSDAGLIRQGCTQASVTAAFAVAKNHPCRLLLEEHGLSDEEELMLRRVIHADGKTRAFINDQPVSVGLLKQIGEQLVEIHGQFETHGLLDATTHRTFLDHFAGLDADVAAVTACFYHLQSSQQALTDAQSQHERSKAEEDYLRAAVQELDLLKPQAQEEVELATRRTRLQNAGKIVEALHLAEQALSSDAGAETKIGEARRAIARIADKAGAEACTLITTLETCADQLALATQQLEALQRALDLNPSLLDETEERLFALRACARKHQVTVDDLPATHQKLADRLNSLEYHTDTLKKLMAAHQAAQQQYGQVASSLSAKRQKAAVLLAKAVNAELPPLKLERAAITVQVEPLPDNQPTAYGLDKITFLANTNDSTAPAPLHKIASGGELARFMLALKVVLTKGQTATTLVFDEIDTGIGGATAMAVGERLARLAAHLQVLLVTHSPQVAAKATTHLRVQKISRAGKTLTQISRLDAAERREEIARMLAGNVITDAARDAADRLLEEEAPSKKCAS